MIEGWEVARWVLWFIFGWILGMIVAQMNKK